MKLDWRHSLAASLIDAGWVAGSLILLLQLSATFMPESEIRDWSQYVLVGGTVALYLASGMAERYIGNTPRWIDWFFKTLLAAYAIAPLTLLFVIPRFSTPWMPMAALLIALESTREMQPQRMRLPIAAGIAWLLLCAFSMFFSLLYSNQTLSLPLRSPDIFYALPCLLGLLLVLARLARSIIAPLLPAAPYKPWHYACHAVVFYLLVVTVFIPGVVRDGTAIHHWKAFLEAADSVRDGGWLLWNVPSQYGFLQTLTLAWLPTATVWQSFYLLNATLITLTGYMVFATLLTRYRSLPGFCLGLSLAIACVVLVLPTTINPLPYPSTSAMRFFWSYTMVGYIFFLAFRLLKTPGRLSTRLSITGNALWIIGALWSPESCFFVTLAWLPTLVLLDWKRLWIAGGMLIATLAAIAGFYMARLGHLPDLTLFTAYTKAYQTYMAIPMTELQTLPCWLCMLILLAILTKRLMAEERKEKLPALLAACYSATVSVWSMASYYIPFSEDFHITGTLPFLVYASALVLLLLPHTALPAAVKALYEKAALCLYAVILLGTLSHLYFWLYWDRDFISPIHPDVTQFLPNPPQDLQEAVEHAGIPPDAHVQRVYWGSAALENSYFHRMNFKPWLLPNSTTGFIAPLPSALYETLAERRAATASDTGWIIAPADFNLNNVPWIKNVVLTHYTSTLTLQTAAWQIIKYERKKD